MYYWFKRGQAVARYEVRKVSTTQYELTFIGPGVERIERFDSANALNDRQLALDRELVADGWQGPQGWNE